MMSCGALLDELVDAIEESLEGVLGLSDLHLHPGPCWLVLALDSMTKPRLIRLIQRKISRDRRSVKAPQRPPNGPPTRMARGHQKPNEARKGSPEAPKVTKWAGWHDASCQCPPCLEAKRKKAAMEALHRPKGKGTSSNCSIQ